MRVEGCAENCYNHCRKCGDIARRDPARKPIHNTTLAAKSLHLPHARKARFNEPDGNKQPRFRLVRLSEAPYIFTEEERAIAFPEKHPYTKAATLGYPYLIEAGTDLASEGVAYIDLTMLFAGNDEILYRDGCCHLNARGNALMAREIARVIKEALERR